MSNLILLLLCFVMGIVFQRIKAIPSNAHITLNQFIIWISLPALTLFYIPQIKINSQILYPLAVAWIIFLLSIAFFVLTGKITGRDKSTTGALVLTAGLGNTSFIGFPVLEMLYGDKGVKTGIVIDQAGSFLVLSTLGILTASAFSANTVSFKQIGKKVISFPPFIALIAAIGILISGYSYPAVVNEVLQRLGNTLTALALVSVGLQLKADFKQVNLKDLLWGLGFKLILAPFFIYLLYVQLSHERGELIQICIMEAAMAPMITASIIAIDNKLNPALSGLMVGAGIPVSFITLIIWYLFVQHL